MNTKAKTVVDAANSLHDDIVAELKKRGYIVSDLKGWSRGFEFCRDKSHSVKASVEADRTVGYHNCAYDAPALQVSTFNDYRFPGAGRVSGRIWKKYKSASELVDKLEKFYADCEPVAKLIAELEAAANDWSAKCHHVDAVAKSLGVENSLSWLSERDSLKIVGLDDAEAIALLERLSEIRKAE